MDPLLFDGTTGDIPDDLGPKAAEETAKILRAHDPSVLRAGIERIFKALPTDSDEWAIVADLCTKLLAGEKIDE